MVEAYKVMNEAPHDDLDVDDINFTPEQLRQQEAAQRAAGILRWTVYARERSSGALAGYTEILFNPRTPTIVQQGATAVPPHYHGHGLGRRLKAAMLARVLRDRPAVRYVRTDNADTNAAILKINQELGFRPYQSNTFWQVEVACARGYLLERPDQARAGG